MFRGLAVLGQAAARGEVEGAGGWGGGQVQEARSRWLTSISSILAGALLCAHKVPLSLCVHIRYLYLCMYT